MIKKLKSALLFVSLFVLISYKIFAPDLLDPFIYDVCSAKYISNKTEQAIKRAERSKKGRIKLQEFLTITNNLNLPPNQKHDVIVTIRKHGLLNTNNCPIPKELEAKLYTYLYGEHKGVKECPLGTYDTLAEERLNSLKEIPNSFNIIRKRLQPELNNNTKAIVEKKWDDQSFRNKFVKTMLQISIREEEKCNNPNLPIKFILKEFMSP